MDCLFGSSAEAVSLRIESAWGKLLKCIIPRGSKEFGEVQKRIHGNGDMLNECWRIKRILLIREVKPQ